MGLNDYRDEAGAFLKGIGAENEGAEIKLKMLEEELSILKESQGDIRVLRHQVYDMLFLLFEIAYEYGLDLDLEWKRGEERKQKKYNK